MEKHIVVVVGNNIKIPASLMSAIKRRAHEDNMSFTRLIREALEHAAQEPE